MRVTEIFMTPQLAAQMLAKNDGNRDLRQTTVKAYAAEMAAGQWRTTHQPIAVDQTGQLVDGQHRLSAVVAANWSGTMLLATYGNAEETMQLPVDRGLRRTMFDVLAQPRSHVEIATRLLKHTCWQRRAAAPHEVLAILNAHQSKIERVLTLCVAKRRVIGSACAMSALLLTAYADRTQEEQEQSLQQYRLFFEQNYGEMWPHVKALNAWLVTGTGARATAKDGRSASDLWHRIYMAFDIRRQNLKISRISNYDSVRDEVTSRARQFINIE